MTRCPCFRMQLAGAVRVLLVMSMVWSSLVAQTAGFLKLTAVEGEGAFNSIRNGYAHPPAVRVVDESNNPASGAEVSFTFPVVGPGAILPGGGTTLSARSDETGVARCPGYKPNREEGRFKIKVTARFQGKTGTVVVDQSNTRAGGVAVGEGKKSGKAYWILALVAGGAVGGVMAAKGGFSSGSPSTPSTTLTSGAITVGGPR